MAVEAVREKPGYCRIRIKDGADGYLKDTAGQVAIVPFAEAARRAFLGDYTPVPVEIPKHMTIKKKEG